MLSSEDGIETWVLHIWIASWKFFLIIHLTLVVVFHYEILGKLLHKPLPIHIGIQQRKTLEPTKRPKPWGRQTKANCVESNLNAQLNVPLWSGTLNPVQRKWMYTGIRNVIQSWRALTLIVLICCMPVRIGYIYSIPQSCIEKYCPCKHVILSQYM